MGQSSYIVVKIGGRAAADEGTRAAFATDISLMSNRGTIVLVHGGGVAVTEVSKRFGIESVFRDGVRVTSAAEMPIVDMVLAGSTNKEWVRTLRAAGVNACGICGADGGLLTGAPEPDSRTAHVAAVDRTVLDALAAGGFVPVVSSVASDSRERGVNINADEVALAVATAVSARALVFLSDTPGVLRDGVTIPHLDADAVDGAVSDGTISGGMIPKVRTSVAALGGGVATICIGRFEQSGDLDRLLSGDAGTRIGPVVNR